MEACPKCQQKQARYTKSNCGQDLFLSCVCGYHKVVATLRQEITIEHFDADDEITLPGKGSKLRKCLDILAGIYPATSADVADRLRLEDSETNTSVSSVSSILTILRYKRLVEVAEDRKGKPGGSTWTITDEAKQLLGVHNK